MDQDPTNAYGQQEWMRLTPDERMVCLCFDDPNPPLVDYPHLCLPCAEPLLDRISSLMDCRLGLWGEWLRFDRDGREVFHDPLSGDAAFSEWEIAENQEFLRRFYCARGEERFRMCIDSRTHVNDMTPMYSDEDPACWDRTTPLRLLPRVLPKIGWALAQLTDDYHLQLFVTSNVLSQKIQELRDWCRSQDIPTGHFARKAGRIVWEEEGGSRSLSEVVFRPE